jgi:hypothetical protein
MSGEWERLMVARGGKAVLRDVLDIKEDAHSGDFKIELSKGFTGSSAGTVAEYVVTPQLKTQFDTALKLIRGAVRKNTSYAAYLHGSFGAGKSHFLSVLHAVLNGDPATLDKPRLREVIAEHGDWLPGKKFLMVPYHLVGAASLESALLGGYARAVRDQYPEEPAPLVHRTDHLLADARNLRSKMGDEAFIGLLPAPQESAAPRAGGDGLQPIGAATAWTGEMLDDAFAAAPDDKRYKALVHALISGPMTSYAESMQGGTAAYIPLEDGLSVMSEHARSLGYDGLILFLDELILWLQARMRERTFVNDEIQKLVKLIESGNANRPVPIVSFISRQRDLSQLLGSDVLGADVRNMEHALEYLKERFTVVDLEDRNLPEIIKERVLKPLPGKEAVLDAAFAGIDRSQQIVKDVLLDDGGATHADWDDFRAVYPLSPALLNVLVALSGALQRQRTGLKLVQQLLERNADAEVGRLIPLGDLWDVLVGKDDVAFTERLKHETQAAQRFHAKARLHLLEKYGREDHPDYLADDRFLKTLLLSALAPDVPALRRLTGARLAALNHGSVRSRTVPVGQKVVERMRALQGEFETELRAEGETDPVFSLHLSDLDVDPLLDSVAGEDKAGARRVWLRDRLWEELGVREGRLVAEKEIIWHGTRRTAEFVFGNVRDARDLSDEDFAPATPGNIRFVLDYPFDDDDKYPSDDYQRVGQLIRDGRTGPTLVWLPDFFSEQRKAQLGRLMRINFLLERDRLTEYTRNFPPDDRAKARRQLELGRDTLARTLTGALAEVYGIADVKEGTRAAEVVEGRHVLSLLPELGDPVPEGGKPFADNALHLAGGLFRAMYPKHPDFGSERAGQRRAVTAGDLRTTLEWITRAMDDGGRAEVDQQHLRTVKLIAEKLELGTVHDGPLVLRADWRTRINQAAAQHQAAGDLAVEDIRGWILKDLGYRGLDKLTVNLLIAAYALLDDRAWVYHSGPETAAPELSAIGSGWALRSQPLPEKDEYERARDRAARLFGVRSKPALFARNVNKLAQDVREKAEEYEKPVGGVRASLERHGELLGLDGDDPAPRTASLREAAGLLARLARHGSDATALVRELANASHATQDRDLAIVMSTAADVLRALDGADAAWRVLSNVRRMSDRDDSLGDRARRLLAQLTEAARAPEHERSLVPVLGGVRETGMAIVEAALHVEHAAPRTPEPAPGPEQVSLSQHGDPRVSYRSPGAGPEQAAPPGPRGTEPQPQPAPEPGPSGAAARSARRIIAAGPTPLESGLAAELDAVQSEIRAFRVAHPQARIEIVWRALDDEPPAEGDH